MFRITSKEEVFFTLFREAADNALVAAHLLEDMMKDYVNVKAKIDEIEKKEHECDQHVHMIIQRLNASFITPFDREDIFLISKELDNITDNIEATAHRFRMFNVGSVREDAVKLVELIVKCVAELKDVMVELRKMKNNKTLRDKIIEVNRIEDEGDNIYRDAIARLFVSDADAVEVIKWKEILEYLENTLDSCEDVANIIEGVVMKHA